MRRFFVILTAVVIYILGWGWRFLSFIGAADAALNMPNFVDAVHAFVIAREEIGWQIAPWVLMIFSTALLVWLAWPEFKERRLAGRPRPAANLDQQSAVQPQADPKKKIPIDVTPEDLVGLYKDRTDVQGGALGTIYLRKWIAVSGPLGNVFPPGYTGEREWTKSKNTMMVTFANRGLMSDLKDVFMRFNEDWFERLQVIPRNKHISVLGQIIEFDRIGVHLWNCELLDTGVQSANAAISSSSQT